MRLQKTKQLRQALNVSVCHLNYRVELSLDWKHERLQSRRTVLGYLASNTPLQPTTVAREGIKPCSTLGERKPQDKEGQTAAPEVVFMVMVDREAVPASGMRSKRHRTRGDC